MSKMLGASKGWTCVCIAACALLWVGCPASGPPGGGGLDGSLLDPDGEPLPELGPDQICYPGSVKECVIENGKQAVICNKWGTDWDVQVCIGPEGDESQCRDSQCTYCYPGTRKCQGEDLVVQCADGGDEWLPYSDCTEGSSGKVCTGQVCESLCDINLKYKSYIGCDYWGVDLDNAFVPGGSEGFFDAQGAQYAIVVANPPASPREAIVEVWYHEGGVEKKVPFDVNGDALPSEVLLPGDLRVYRLPRRDVNGTVQAPLAYRVTSSVPIIAYQFNPLENENVFSNDASLLLPSTLLGKDYVVMTREQTFDILRGYLTVVAVLPGVTTVSVDVTAHVMGGEIYPDTSDEEIIGPMSPGDTKIFKLNQYDVLSLETDRAGADLTGSRILSDQRIAVFGGSEAANAPNTARCVDFDPVSGLGVCEYDGETTCQDLMDCVDAGYNTCCADHLEQQLFPIKTWGTSYVATKSWDRGLESDIWRVIAAKDNTKVMLIPPQQGISIPVLNRGEWFEFESRNHFEIHSINDSDTAPDKPILVASFLAAQDAPDPNVGGVDQQEDAGTGDPAFMLTVPVQQYRRDFVILTPAEYEFSYVNIITPTGAEVAIDDEPVPSEFFEIIGSGAFSVYRSRIKNPGAHTITSSEPAGVMVYGYDQYVSYGYTGGLDLNELNSESPFGTDPGE